MKRSQTFEFRAVSRPCRLHSGDGALDRIGDELKRAGVNRALLICGRSVATGTHLVEKISNASDGRLAGVFDRMGKDAPIDDIEAAVALAREIGADGLIALGGGSVVQATRITAILLAEDGAPEALATQYPDDGPAISPRLMADKLPIVNVLTIGTTAQDRGGSPSRRADGGRLEFFDPKTRPVALFWDRAALASAPVSMLRATAAMTYWRALVDMGYQRAPILADLNRRQTYQVTRDLCTRLSAGDEGDEVRAQLCVATWMMNRAADDGAPGINTWASRVTYAFSTALFNRHQDVSQGAANAAIAPTALRELGSRDPQALVGMADAAGLDAGPEDSLPDRLADHVAEVMAGLGHATRIGPLDVPRDSADPMLDAALTNFNADPKREFRRERDRLAEVLSACW